MDSYSLQLRDNQSKKFELAYRTQTTRSEQRPVTRVDGFSLQLTTRQVFKLSWRMRVSREGCMGETICHIKNINRHVETVSSDNEKQKAKS